jgi:serine/threonine protein kinase
LTASVLTGSDEIPSAVLQLFNPHSNPTEKYIETKEHPDVKHWERCITRRAMSFLSGLLKTNPSRRLTAVEAIEHKWFTKPESEANLIQKAHRQLAIFHQRGLATRNAMQVNYFDQNIKSAVWRHSRQKRSIGELIHYFEGPATKRIRK